MWNIFEKPWTLLLIAVLVLLATAIARTFFLKNKNLWQWTPTIIIILAAFGLDYFIKTDFEKIKTVITAGAKAVEKENCDTIEKILSENYKDSYHLDKNSVLQKCKTILTPPLVSKVYSSILQKDIQADKAKVVVLARILFDENSEVYSFTKIMLIKTEIEMQKGSDNNWRINRIEVLEINKQPAKWKNVSYSEW